MSLITVPFSFEALNISILLLGPAMSWLVHGFVYYKKGDFRWNDVTSGHVRSRHVISSHVTACSGELLPCRKSSASKTWFSAFYSHIQVTSGLLRVTCGNVMSFPVMLLPPTARYNLVGRQTHQRREISAFYSYFQVTFGQMTSLLAPFRSHDIISCHVIDSFVLQPCRKSNAPKTRVLGILQQMTSLPGQMTSLPGHSRSRQVTWRHFLSRDFLLRATAL